MEIVSLLPILLVMGAFVFFASRRQRKAMQATIDLHDSLRVGDRVHTTAGLEGVIAGLDEDTVDLEIAPGVVTRWMKLAIRDRIEADDETETELDEDAAPESSAVELTESTADRRSDT